MGDDNHQYCRRRLQGLALGLVSCLLITHQAWAQSLGEDCEGGGPDLVKGEDYFCDGDQFCNFAGQPVDFATEEELLASVAAEPGESCTGLNASSETLQGEFQRVYMTDYLYRYSSVIQHRFFGGRGGGGDVAAGGGNDLAGRAAGDGFANWSPWLSYARTGAENDLSSTAYDGTIDSFLAGADYSFSERLIAGVSLGYENNDVDTSFNAGRYKSDGFTVAPYVAYMLTESVSIDGTVGYSRLDIDQTRTDPGSGETVSASTDTNRWFVAANINKYHQYRNLALLGRVGVIYSEDDMGGFTESGPGGETVGSNTSKFGQIQIGGEMAYTVHAVEPFASVYYQYDYKRDRPRVGAGQARPSGDDDDFRISGGFRYFGNSGFSGSLEYSGIVGRSDYDSHSINLIGRLQF